MNCVRTVRYSFLVNGEPSRDITPTRGLQQGDAISPYLFLVCAEVLSRMINEAETNDRIHGIRVCTGAPVVNHLFFADDSFIFSKAEVEDVLSMKQIFVAYERMSGQQINYDKSCISFSKNVPWGEFGDERKIRWIAWDILCSTKKEGGLGFRDMNVFNRALLAKQGWRMICRPQSLLAQVLQVKYFPSTCFMQAEIRKKMSYSWRSMLKGQQLLTKGLRYQVGNGEMISIWNDPWVPLPYNFKPFSDPMQGSEDMRVCDLIDGDIGEWNVEVIEDLFNPMEIDLILKIPLSLYGDEDRMVWHFDKKGCCTVKSGYYVGRLVEGVLATILCEGQMVAVDASRDAGVPPRGRGKRVGLLL
ncbi:hypothetical protein ACLB2K_047088 [Fragaria x ananassa]